MRKQCSLLPKLVEIFCLVLKSFNWTIWIDCLVVQLQSNTSKPKNKSVAKVSRVVGIYPVTA